MKRALISGIFVLLFFGQLLFAQPLQSISVNPPSPIPPVPVEIRYYEGKAIMRYGNGGNTIGTAYVWAEKIVNKNLFRMRYMICYEDNGACMMATYPPAWFEGEERNGIWIFKQGNTEVRLGLKHGHVNVEGGSLTIRMNLELH